MNTTITITSSSITQIGQTKSQQSLSESRWISQWTVDWTVAVTEAVTDEFRHTPTRRPSSPKLSPSRTGHHAARSSPFSRVSLVSKVKAIHPSPPQKTQTNRHQCHLEESALTGILSRSRSLSLSLSLSLFLGITFLPPRQRPSNRTRDQNPARNKTPQRGPPDQHPLPHGPLHHPRGPQDGRDQQRRRGLARHDQRLLQVRVRPSKGRVSVVVGRHWKMAADLDLELGTRDFGLGVWDFESGRVNEGLSG